MGQNLGPVARRNRVAAITYKLRADGSLGGLRKKQTTDSNSSVCQGLQPACFHLRPEAEANGSAGYTRASPTTLPQFSQGFIQRVTFRIQEPSSLTVRSEAKGTH